MTERERPGETSSPSASSEIRLVWRDGPFQLECAGRQGALRLKVFEGGRLQAQEDVVSAESAYVRGRDLCQRLEHSRRLKFGKKGSA